MLLAVSAWHLRKGIEVAAFTKSTALAISVLVPVSIALVLVGSQLGVIETRYQPMKIAAAEAQWETCQPCSFSAFQIGGGKNDEDPTKVIAIPHLLSLLATLKWDGQVVGLNELQASVRAAVRAGELHPERVRAVLVDAGDGVPRHRHRAALAVGRVAAAPQPAGGVEVVPARRRSGPCFTPFVMNTAGWMLTENGRQPWIVQGLMKTADGISPSVSTPRS